MFITVGLTFYGGDFIGQEMAWGDTYTESLGTWAAVPVEWVKSGYVGYEDMVVAILKDGRVIEAPIRDTGCHLHFPTYDSGLPYGADFSIYGRDGAPTGTGTMAVRKKNGEWWIPPSTLAWDTETCHGPLSHEIITPAYLQPM